MKFHLKICWTPVVSTSLICVRWNCQVPNDQIDINWTDFSRLIGLRLQWPFTFKLEFQWLFRLSQLTAKFEKLLVHWLSLSWVFHWFMFGDKFDTWVWRAIFTSFPNNGIRLNWYHVHTHSVRSESISFLLWTFTYHPYHFHNQIWNHYDLWIIIFSMEQTHWIGQLKSTQSSELESSPTNQFEVKRRFYYQ